ncbi:elongation factor 2, putative [Babesia ovis]|uniref:Elongation factor 2, putative n=1 Tax=Babesia ovis TaxID=5869 RepID=A0A9W5TCE5_BABOV|nr:elongation factor 2, putative [Babesia ovis]
MYLNSKLVVELVEARDVSLQTLPLPNAKDDFVQLGTLLKGVTAHQLPVVKHTLWEGLTRGAGTKGGSETETLGDREVSLDLNKRGTSSVLLVEDVATTLVESAVYTTYGILWTVDIHKEYGLLELGLGSQLTGVETPTAEDVTSWEPDLHNSLKKGLASEITVLTLQFDTNGLKLCLVFLLVVVHDVGEQTANGLHNEVAEGAFRCFRSRLREPYFTGLREEVITPEVVHHLLLRDTELGVVDTSKGLNGESPTVKTRTEGDGTFFGIYLDISHEFIVVCGNDDIHVFNATEEGHVDFFRSHLEF